MGSVVKEISDSFKKPAVVKVKSGDTVRVHQKIKEGNKERIQVFEGLVIRTRNVDSQTASILVRRQTGGLGVEKGYLLHSPLVTKVEIVKRGKVRRNYLTYMRELKGKATRLTGVKFDKQLANELNVEKEESIASSDEKTEKTEVEKPEKYTQSSTAPDKKESKKTEASTTEVKEPKETKK